MKATEGACPFCGAVPGPVWLPRVALGVGLAMAAGCTGGPGDDGGESGAMSADSTGGGQTTADDVPGSGSGMISTGPAVTSTGDATTTGPADSSDGGGFIYGAPDLGDAIECSVFAQDCPAGEKCTPWANDGGEALNATRCRSIDPSPDNIGEACTVEGSLSSGVDSCDLGSLCRDVDPRTSEGACVPICAGTPEAPLCPDGLNCEISDNGLLALCI